MTFYELTTSLTLQGNIEVKVFDADGDLKESRCFRDLNDFSCTCTDTNDLEECEVTYMYATKSADGEAWLVIEIAEVDLEV